MMKKRDTEEQMIPILKKCKAGTSVSELSHRTGVAANTIYRWKSKFGGMELSETRRLRELAVENARLKRRLAELDKLALKELVDGKW